MSQSLVTNLVHIIFSTKNRQPLIHQKIEERLHSYMAGIFKACDSPAILIGGTTNHVHILSSLSKNYSLSKVIENIKKSSSKWIKTLGTEYKPFYWQNGYAAFSISPSSKEATMKYIQNQKDHHRKKTFQAEYLEFLGKNQMEYDERFIWE